MVPTDDTPEERDEKAAVLAKELRRFRWEFRTYIAILFLFVVVKAIFGD